MRGGTHVIHVIVAASCAHLRANTSGAGTHDAGWVGCASVTVRHPLSNRVEFNLWKVNCV